MFPLPCRSFKKSWNYSKHLEPSTLPKYLSYSIWSCCKSRYIPLSKETVDVPSFDREALIKALEIDQVGQSTFPEFLKASWEAGVVRYVVDFEKLLVIYYGVSGESKLPCFRDRKEVTKRNDQGPQKAVN